MKIAFITLGCKVNSYETDAISDLFVKRGEVIVDSKDEFDVCIINTCSVTNQATVKSRKMIRSAIKANPNAIICVMGCYSQMDSTGVSEIEGVDIVIGNENKSQIVDLVYKKIKEKELINKVTDILKYRTFENLSPISFSKTRAFLKIEDGCNNFCSYCIIPYTRGPIRSKPYEDVINEINKIIKNGYKEVVLTGIHTGKYHDDNVSFTDLVKMILNETKLERLRVSSIELNEVTDEFIDLLKNSKVIAKHLHLPLQAGSDHILKLMNRHYTRDEFISKVKMIKEIIPDISITTDIIVGFPLETDEDFKNTLDLCKIVGFSKIHAFPFSLRKGTKAEEYKEVPAEVKKERMNQLLELDSTLEREFKEKHINTIHSIIFEQKYGEYYVGHTSNYLEVLVQSDIDLTGKMVEVKIISLKDDKLYGEII